MNQRSPGLIPDQLLTNIKKGDCVLFLGADLPLNYPGAPLSRPELATALARKYGLPPGQAWPDTAQAYLGQRTGDRHGLISFVVEHCSGPQVKPGPLHQAIARVGFRAIVTAWYDELLEETLRRAGYRVNRVVRDTQLTYAQEGEREVIVIKLYGCLSDPDSLVLDAWDHEELMERLSRKLELIIGFCSLRPPLFVGFDLMDRTPMRLYVRASTGLGKHVRRAYAVWSHSLDVVQTAWQGKNVEFSRADATAFLTALASQLPIARPDQPGAIRIQRPPYKFLNYYEIEDANIFCGRDTESQIVTRLALSHRLLTLFGPSGVGKTSLLLAGVLPRLAAEEYQYIYVRALDDPLSAIRKSIAAKVGRVDWQFGANLSIFLSEVLGSRDKLVVILDQLEELFLRVGSHQRANFFTELAGVLTNMEREVRFIFSLREDYLAQLDEARFYLPDIFNNSFRLTTLERGNARLAIIEPAARAGITIESTLVDVLVGSERQEAGSQKRGALVEAHGQVPPAALQIVLDRLYREALPPDCTAMGPPPPGLRLTLVTYQGIRHQLSEGGEELHGVEAILAGYVDEGLAHLTDPTLAEAILKVMVTSQATKAALTKEEIIDWLDESGLIQANDQTDRNLVEQTRLELEKVRLLRGFERDGVVMYELAHDYLAAEVARRMDVAELGSKLAREILRREMGNWQESGLLIRPEILERIHAQRESLKRLRPPEVELLFRSAFESGYEIMYWAKRASELGISIDKIILARLNDNNFRTRVATITTLRQCGQVFTELIIKMLGDPYPQVRVAAIVALEQIAPRGDWRAYLEYECYVPAGEFIMGDDDDENDYSSNKVPAHKVFVDAFYLGKYPVTNADYKRYMDDIGRPFDVVTSRPDHPVTGASWYDAWGYAAWAGMRLLTEAEWEKAASWEVDEDNMKRGEMREKGELLPGRKRKYPWGDAFDNQKCNTWIRGTTHVKTFSSTGNSPYGCVDMAGNVWEWCNTMYQSYPYDVDDGRETTGLVRINRVQRGGSFIDIHPELSVRCASRTATLAHVRSKHFGFRVGWSISAPFKLESTLLTR